MAVDISNDRALGCNLRLPPSLLFQAQGETSPGKILDLHCRSLAVIGSRETSTSKVDAKLGAQTKVLLVSFSKIRPA
jgi:hypothetical protein